MFMNNCAFFRAGGKDPPRARGTGAVKDPRTRTTADSLDPGKFIYRHVETHLSKFSRVNEDFLV